jgi:7,8-dihydropterin-6-yl-methyl-4-(beta-D-ribofuranosyl)aminobenzene 5'-phosphate synthase
MRFITLFDNYKHKEDLESLWGFSCFIELDTGKNLLFDTGSDGRVLLRNAKKMGIDFKNIDIVFISHPHWDHIGGLDTIIEENPDITLIVPNSLSSNLINNLKQMVKDIIIVKEDFFQINFSLYSTGVQNKEHSLVIEKDNKLFVITGCAHQGIENIIKITLQKLNTPIKYLFGGFHLKDKNPKEIKDVINQLDTKYICATHCSGDTAIGMIKVFFKNRCLDNGVGSMIIFE